MIPNQESQAQEAKATKEASRAAKRAERRKRFRKWLFGKTPYIIVIMLGLVIALVILWFRIVIVIDAGQAGVLFRLFTGTQIDYVYSEGLHIISPLNTMYKYEVRKQVALHEFDILTSRGMTVHLSLAIRYQPEMELLGMLHQRIGPDYLKRVIVPQIESVMRRQLGSYTAEDIYTNKEGLLTNTILLALDEVGRNFVKMDDIIIRSIQMPETIKGAIEDKLSQEELLKSYEYRVQTAERDAERKTIEGRGISAYNDLVTKSLNENILKNAGIDATKELAKSNNAKIIVIGSGKDGLPLILNAQ